MTLIGVPLAFLACLVMTVMGALVLVAVIAVIVEWQRRFGNGFPVLGVKRTYAARRVLFTKGEAAFYRTLMQAVEGRYTVMGKVRLADIVEVQRSERSFSALNRITSKHVDFVLLEPGELTIALVIELDDRSHQQQRRRERDDFVDEALRQAGVSILHVRAAYSYHAESLWTMIDGAVDAAGV